VCKDSGSLAGGQKNIVTVVGEYIELQCFFRGNVLDQSLFVSWEVSYPHDQQLKHITDNSTHPYRIAYFQTCLTGDGSCCKFVNRLIFKASSEMNDANFACIAAIDGNTTLSSSNISESICIGKNQLIILNQACTHSEQKTSSAGTLGLLKLVLKIFCACAYSLAL